MDDLKQLMRKNYIQYASYVILDRAIPDAIDGLKPVQRRILHTLFTMDDGKLHKVANVVGQTMAYHPHGDAPIGDALINIANKGYLLEMQGNFGNIYTGDPAAAARYIETKLSSLAKETIFNPDITSYILSYDSRKKEPLRLPAKIPLLLLQGAEGIAVGMATKILPHNFVELLEAEIAILQKNKFEIFPDFPTGGIIDISQYDKGQGKIKLRAKLNIIDSKTIVISEICYGTTAESLMNSIDDAAKKGKIKIESINDYTTDKVQIEIKLPRGQYAADLFDSLYAFTECEVSINSQIIAIKDNLPWETNTHDVLHEHSSFLKASLQQELEIERKRFEQKIFAQTLEQIFIENRLYKKLEEINSYEKIHATIEKSLQPFHKLLKGHIPIYEDREKLLNIPIRRISRFDLERNQKEIAQYEDKLSQIHKNLSNLTRFTVKYLKDLLKKYGFLFPRNTQITSIEQIDLKTVSKRDIKIGIDYKKGFVGSKVADPTGITCSNLDKILLFFESGSYKVINPPEKEYVLAKQDKLIEVIVADKETVHTVIYRDPVTNYPYAKRFIIKKFILDKVYHFIEPDMLLEFFSSEKEPTVIIHFKSRAKQKLKKLTFNFDDVMIKGVSAKGIRVANKEFKKLTPFLNKKTN